MRFALGGRARRRGLGPFAQEPDPEIAKQPARPSPVWLKSGVIYQIFVRAFSPAGDLNGVTARLDELHALNVNILWLMPIHPDGQVKKKGSLGSPYAVRDYYAIDPALGTKDDLHGLVQEAHKRQMKVIIDIVANHTAWDSVMMAHPDFYKKDAQGHITYPHDWTDVAWLDYSNPKLRQYMLDMLVYWIKDFDLDGYRCDAASELPTDFWEQARVALEKVKPDIMLLAEANKPDLLKSAFDIDYSWPLMHTLERRHHERRTGDRNSHNRRTAAGALPHRRAAHAHQRRSRRAAGDYAIQLSRRDRRLGADLHARWRTADLQRHGGRRLHPVGRARALRTAENLLGCSGLASGLSEVLRSNRRATQNTSGARARRTHLGA